MRIKGPVLACMAAMLAWSLKLSATQSAPCASPPAAPLGLAAIVAESDVSLTWDTPAGCAPTDHVVYAGSAPGTTDIATIRLANVRRFSVTAPAGTYFVFIVAQNAFGSSPPSAVVPIVIAKAHAPAPVMRTPLSITPGAWRVTRHVQPGRYYADPHAGCYWERQRGFSGALSDVIANEFIPFDAAQWIVDIFSTDAGFESDPACGTWSSAPRVSRQSAIRPGVWLVGAQIPAGTYRAEGAAGCYWARLRNFTSQLDGIVDNDFAPLDGPQFVTLLGTDVGFESDADCGTWTRVADDADPSRNPFPTSDELLLRWMLNQEQESARHPSARGRRAADAASR